MYCLSANRHCALLVFGSVNSQVSMNSPHTTLRGAPGLRRASTLSYIRPRARLALEAYVVSNPSRGAYRPSVHISGQVVGGIVSRGDSVGWQLRHQLLSVEPFSFTL